MNNSLDKKDTARYDVELADMILAWLGMPRESRLKVTGMGHRRGFDCKPDDSVLNKFASGAMSRYGAFGAVYGSDSHQHHMGYNLPLDTTSHSMYCAVCGAWCKGRQWGNRDTGHGICADCAGRQEAKYGADHMLDLYGVAGYHYFTD